MKRIVFLILFVSILGCDKNSDADSKGIKYFDPENLYQLDLANIDNFWSEGIDIDTSYYMGANFENHSGFIEGIRLFSGNGKAIWISVFKTKEDAINAMELRINDVACVINNGNPDEFENQWWYSDYMDYLIFENQYNTIVEIDFSSNAPVDLIKDSLLDFAEEINERIDNLSVYVN
ncbi:hypothetical protein ES708_30098 [subsurface metagenome]